MGALRLFSVLLVTFTLAACSTSSDMTGAGTSDSYHKGGKPTLSDGDRGAGRGYYKAERQQGLTNEAGNTVFFAFDRYDLDSEAQAVLKDQAEYLKKNAGTEVIVEGHCDERGTREYNLALGERRATAAKNYLVALGVSADRVSTISYGKERPEESGSNETAWAKNRRAVTVVK
jgi:peptidoglycan-associated lipoprotein